MTDEDNQSTDKTGSAGGSSRKRAASRRAADPPQSGPPPQSAAPAAAGTSTPPLVLAALAVGVLGLIVGAVGWNKADSARKLVTEQDFGQVQTVSAEVAEVQAAQSALQDRYAALENQFAPLAGQYDALATRYAGLEQQYSTLAVQDGPTSDELGTRLNQLHESLESAQQQLDQQLQSYQTSLSDQYSVDEQTSAEEMQGFRTAFGELSQAVSTAHADLGRSIQNWSLKEVEQLLMLANQRVQLARDPVTAHAALQLADARLAAIEDPELTEVRRMIAEETARLESVENVDVPGLALRLGALAGEIDALPLPKDEPTVATPEAADGAGGGDDQGNAWAQAGRRLLDDMSSMISVRNVEQTRKPMLPVEQEYFLRENLRLMLNSAQLALLRGDQEVYAQLLEGAGQWVGVHFDGAQDAVGRFGAALSELQSVAIRPVLPDIAASLAELRKLIQARGAL